MKIKSIRLIIKILLSCFFIIFINACYVYAEAGHMQNTEVKFPIGADYFLVNGEKVNTDAPSYISEEGVVMIPLRTTCNLFGIKDRQIIWDKKSQSVKIINNDGKSIEFAVDENGFLSENSTLVDKFKGHTELKAIEGKSHVYVPFITFAYAYELSASWNEETKTAIFNEDYTKAASPSLELEMPKADILSVGFKDFIIYNGIRYSLTNMLMCDEAAKKPLLGEFLGTPDEYDAWTYKRDYMKEFIASFPGKVYSVNGYDKKFRICIPRSAGVDLYESFEGIALKKGRDLFGVLLNLKDNYVDFCYQSIDDWNNFLNNYKHFKNLTSTDYDSFIDALYNADFIEFSPEDEGRLFNYYNIKQAQVYIKMKDETIVELRLFENGYVSYYTTVFVQPGFFHMDEDIFYKIFEASL